MTPANITIYQFVNLCDHKMYRKSDQKRTYQKLLVSVYADNFTLSFPGVAT